MDEVQQLHTYEPLEKSMSIRLLRLEPGRDNHKLAGHLEHHEMTHALDYSTVCEASIRPPYEAISYVWGDPVFDQPIHLSTGKRYLTRSLADALRGVRLPDRHRYVWADAVCINQSMLAEKTHQVKQMGAIYSNAERVLVWLGIDSEKLASKIFKTITDTSNQPRVVEDRGAALFEIATKEWFTRVWVVQELLLGSRPLLLWGRHQIDFKEFERHLQYLFSYRLKLDHRWMGMGSMFVDMFQFMSWLRPMHCSDQHDRIYAVQGLKYQPRCQSSQEICLLQPDYEMSVDQLFLDVACIFLRHGNAARVFSCVNRPHKITAVNNGLPSWVPDWSFGANFEPFDRQGLDPYPNITAPTILRLSADKRILSIEGFIDATIASCITPVLDSGSTNVDPLAISSVEKIVQCWQQHVLPLKSTLSAAKYVQYELSFMRSLLTQEDDPHAMHKNSDWKAILKATFWHPDQAVINSINNMLESFHESMCRSPIAPFSRPMHIRSTCDYWHSRRLFITTEGNIGLGPAAMQPADIVAILSRVDHPAILRREQQGWTLIGLAYIAVFDQEYMGTRWTGHGERLQFFDLK